MPHSLSTLLAFLLKWKDMYDSIDVRCTSSIHTRASNKTPGPRYMSVDSAEDRPIKSSIIRRRDPYHETSPWERLMAVAVSVPVPSFVPVAV